MNDDNDGWFFANDSGIRDADGKPVGRPNVSGKFEDYRLVDGAASKAAGGRKNIYRVGIILKTKIHMTSMGTVSNEQMGQVMQFDAYPEEAAARIRRFPDAWRAYQKYRKAPLQEGEEALLAEIGMAVPKPKRKPERSAKVVPLKPDVA